LEPLLGVPLVRAIAPATVLLALDLNGSTAQLQAQLGLASGAWSGLVRERGRGPFQDLADLQHTAAASPRRWSKALIGTR